MVELKPYTDSGEKVYGFSLFSDWDKYSALEIAALSYFYGIDTEYVSPLMETNVVTKETNCILREDSFYKRALRFYFMANQRGLLDPDSMTQSYSSLDKKFSEGRIMFSRLSGQALHISSYPRQAHSHTRPAAGHCSHGLTNQYCKCQTARKTRKT